jgi:hypothetical protein
MTPVFGMCPCRLANPWIEESCKEPFTAPAQVIAGGDQCDHSGNFRVGGNERAT